MTVLLINGPVVDDSDAWFYDWWDDPYVSPGKVRAFLEEAKGQPIQVSINSGGGSVFAGSEIYTMLKSYSGRVDVVVSGLAASIASVIMLAGDTIKASPMAQVMIHNAQMGTFGDYRDFEHASVVIGGVSQSLVGLYAQRTGLSTEELKSLVDAESWFTASRAKELGFVDEVLFESDLPLVATVGNMVPKDKIAEFKAMMNAGQGPGSGPGAQIEARLTALEEKIEALMNRPVAEVKVDLDVDELAQKLVAHAEEREAKPQSPFGKFC